MAEINGLIKTSMDGSRLSTGNNFSYSTFASSMACGSVQYFPFSYFFKIQKMDVTKLIGVSVKNSPNFCCHSRFRASMMVRLDSVASVMSTIVSGDSRLQRWDLERSSKLIMYSFGGTGYLSMFFSAVL